MANRRSTKPFALQYTVNSVDFNCYRELKAYRDATSSKLGSAISPSQTVFITELNPDVMTPASYGPWDVFRPDQMTFDKRGRKNANARMMHADDRRHEGTVGVIFLDGHMETRRLTKEKLPITLFNPLDEVDYR